MPVPDFSPGEVLTAAAMDSIGLWLVKTQTLSTGSTAVTNVFSSDYDSYFVAISFGVTSAGGRISLQLNGTTGANYFTAGSFVAYGVTTVNPLATSGAGESSWYWGESNTGGYAVTSWINGPNLASKTFFTSDWMSNGLNGNVGGVENTNNVHTGFTLSLASGTFTSGTVRVYGARK